MVISKNSKSHRLVESLIKDEQLINKSNKIEKNKNKNGKKNKKNIGKSKETKKDLSVQTQQNSNEYHEFISATPDYLSTQTYQQQDLYNGMNNNASPLQTDYYSIYNQLAGNTLLSNVLNYNGYMNPNSYFSPVNNISPVYSAYSDIEHNSYPMYSPNIYSYPLSAPLNYSGYVMPYSFGYNEPIKVKKSKKKGVKKQALKDYRNHEQQLIDQFHKNISENKANKIVGKKKINKDQKENKKNRRISSKNLKIYTNATPKFKPVFDRTQLIQNNSGVQPVFNPSNVLPTYTKSKKKESKKTKGTRVTKNATTRFE